MSYPNVGGYNPAQMSYAPGSNPNYPGAQQGGYGANAPSGYGQGHYPSNQPGGYAPGHPGGHQGSHPGGNPGGHPGSNPGGHPGSHPGQQPPGAPSGQGVNPEIMRWFSAVDRDRSGKITAKELQSALVNGQGKNFSDQACSLMIGMFDRDKSGSIDVQEFQQLYNYINQWIATFRAYDRDNSGHIEEAELSQAFQQMGFRFSPEFIKFLITRSDLQSHAKIAVDQFIVLCVQIQRFTVPDDPDCLSSQSGFDKSKRKRKHKAPNEVEEKGEDRGNEYEDDANSISECKESAIDRTESEICHSKKTDIDSNMEVVRLRAELNQLITENVHLIQENKQLQEDNRTLEQKASRLEQENEKLRQEHSTALELTSWLSSAKEITESLKKSTEIVKPALKKSVSISRSFENQPRHVHPPTSRQGQFWDDVDVPITNGSIPSGQHIKQESPDNDTDQIQTHCGEESPYHTPLLNFDQVDFPPREEPCVRDDAVQWDRPLEGENEADRIGRDQLLHPEPVEGVCELCPGSRIFVTSQALDNILNKRSHSSVARSCLEAIFKTTYLLSCSVQGNIAKGPYGKPEVQRPSLYRPAVECILKYARYLAERNGWKIEENTTIKKQMNTRLSELRNIAKYKSANLQPPPNLDNT